MLRREGRGWREGDKDLLATAWTKAKLTKTNRILIEGD